MFEEPNKATLNHKFQRSEDYAFVSEPATQEEVDTARQAFGSKHRPSLRSCWECNMAHVGFLDDPDFSFQCFACGKVFHGGIDIINYQESELEAHSHLCTEAGEEG